MAADYPGDFSDDRIWHQYVLTGKQHAAVRYNGNGAGKSNSAVICTGSTIHKRMDIAVLCCDCTLFTSRHGKSDQGEQKEIQICASAHCLVLFLLPVCRRLCALSLWGR